MSGTSLTDTRQTGERNFNQDVFVSNTLTAVRIATKGKSTVRIYPELDAEGNPVPMLTSVDPLMFSAIHREFISLGQGIQTKYTGSIVPSDRLSMGDDNREEPNLPFLGLYIAIKGQLNKLQRGEVGSTDLMRASTLIGSAKDSVAPMGRVAKCALLQGTVFQENGQSFAQPKDSCGIILTTAAISALATCLTEAALAGIDVFHPTQGYMLEFVGVPSPDNKPAGYKVSLGTQLAFPEGYPHRFRPWDSVIKRLPYDELIRKMVSSYGADIVSLRRGFAEDIERLGLANRGSSSTGSSGHVAPLRPTTPAAANPWGTTAVATAVAPAPAAPAPAANPWGTVAAKPANAAEAVDALRAQTPVAPVANKTDEMRRKFMEELKKTEEKKA